MATSCLACGRPGRDMCTPCHKAFVLRHSHTPVNVSGGGEFASDLTNSMGTQAEHSFTHLCLGKGMQLRNATSFENTRLHFDFIVKKGDGTFAKVEVKAMKARRRGQLPDPSIVYIETKNVSGGDGWLFGAADDVAFAQPWGFLVVPRIALVKLVEYWRQLVKRANTSGIPYTLYGRMNRKDEVMVLPIEEIYKLPVQKLM